MSLFKWFQDSESGTREARQWFRRSIARISPDEVSSAAHLGAETHRRLEDEVPSALAALWQQFQLLVWMLRDYVQGTYREVPFGSIAAVAAAVLYLACPVDSIPDFIPGLGYVDDAAVLMTCLRMVRRDVEAYREWRELVVA
jgi:uncharacterized membrane protein YkvA (DUF1232 family)